MSSTILGQWNFIAGTNVSITVAHNATTGRFDVTINATGGASLGPTNPSPHIINAASGPDQVPTTGAIPSTWRQDNDTGLWIPEFTTGGG